MRYETGREIRYVQARAGNQARRKEQDRDKKKKFAVMLILVPTSAPAAGRARVGGSWGRARAGLSAVGCECEPSPT